MAWDPFARLRGSLHATFGGVGEDRMGVPAWQYELERGDDGGFFAPHSAVWAVHGGMTPIAAGVRALLVQALHPGALAGVAEHSDYERDALGRLNGTIRWIFTLTYGDTVAARRACEAVRKMHVPVRGYYEGVGGARTYYSANSPHLDLWVHCAFTDAFLAAHELFEGKVPVPPDALPGESGADAYVREWAVAGTLMGVQDPPRSRAELDAALAGFEERGELRCDDRTRRVLGFVRMPPLEPSLATGYSMLFRGVVDTLPDRWRERLGLEVTGIALPSFGGRPRRWRMPRLGWLGARSVVWAAGVALDRKGPAELAALARMRRVGAHGLRPDAG